MLANLGGRTRHVTPYADPLQSARSPQPPGSYGPETKNGVPKRAASWTKNPPILLAEIQTGHSQMFSTNK
jgi:hypothetical protein